MLNIFHGPGWKQVIQTLSGYPRINSIIVYLVRIAFTEIECIHSYIHNSFKFVTVDYWIYTIFIYQVCSIIAAKRIELESPGCLGFEEN